MKNLLRIGIGFLLMFLIVRFAHAQDQVPSSNHNLWISAGFGATTVSGLAGSANLSFRYKYGLVSLRTTASTRFKEKGWFGPTGDDYFDRALIVGICLKKQELIASFGVGVSRVFGSLHDPEASGGILGVGKSVDFPAVFGFPIEAQYLALLGKGFGVGLYGYLNLNAEQIFGGITFNLVFGGLQ